MQLEGSHKLPYACRKLLVDPPDAMPVHYVDYDYEAKVREAKV